MGERGGEGREKERGRQGASAEGGVGDISREVVRNETDNIY